MQTVAVSFLLAGVGAGVASAAAFAQDPMISDRVAKAMPTSYGDPSCSLKGSHYKVTSANTDLKDAIETKKPDKRAEELQKGERTLTELLQDKKQQEKNGSAWYALGRIYLYQGNVVGAD